MVTFQELADRAFSDLLKKHGRPANLKDALRRADGTKELRRCDSLAQAPARAAGSARCLPRLGMHGHTGIARRFEAPDDHGHVHGQAHPASATVRAMSVRRRISAAPLPSASR